MMHQPARGMRLPRLEPTLLLAFVLPVFAWAPLTYPGYFVFRSGFLPIFNLVDRTAHGGDVAWAPTVGRMYGLLTGEGALPYTLGALLSEFGLAPADTIKLMLGASFIVGGVGAYFWVRGLVGRWPALVASAVYSVSPIWLHAVYTQGVFAEAVVLGLLPWVLWAGERALHGRWSWVVGLMLLTAVALWTQAGLTLAFVALAVVYLVALKWWQREQARRLALPIAGLASGLLFGALGLLPLLLRRGPGTTDWPGPQWIVLLAPWLALLGGWIAHRLVAQLPAGEARERIALFAALIALPLLGVYGDVQPIASTVAAPGAPVAIYGDNEIALLSITPEGTPGPGGLVAVDVVWQALRPLTRDYTVFFHVIVGNDERVAQLDTMPHSGQLPTTRWQPGEVVHDRYEAIVASAAPIEGNYRYWLGWYLGATGARLPMRVRGMGEPGAPTTYDDKYILRP